VNEVKFSSLFLIFSRKVLGKRRGLSASCEASLSLCVKRNVVSSFSKILASSQEGFLFNDYILFTITFIML
jgi:hypothetical protein